MIELTLFGTSLALLASTGALWALAGASASAALVVVSLLVPLARRARSQEPLLLGGLCAAAAGGALLVGMRAAPTTWSASGLVGMSYGLASAVVALAGGAMAGGAGTLVGLAVLRPRARPSGVPVAAPAPLLTSPFLVRDDDVQAAGHILTDVEAALGRLRHAVADARRAERAAGPTEAGAAYGRAADALEERRVRAEGLRQEAALAVAARACRSVVEKLVATRPDDVVRRAVDAPVHDGRELEPGLAALASFLEDAELARRRLEAEASAGPGSVAAKVQARADDDAADALAAVRELAARYQAIRHRLQAAVLERRGGAEARGAAALLDGVSAPSATVDGLSLASELEDLERLAAEVTRDLDEVDRTYARVQEAVTALAAGGATSVADALASWREASTTTDGAPTAAPAGEGPR